MAEPFARLGAEMLRLRHDGQDLGRNLDKAVEHVLAGIAELAVHLDMLEGLHALADLGVRLVT